MTPPPDNAALQVVGTRNTMEYVDGEPLKGVLLGYFGTRCSNPACASHLLLQNLDYRAAKVYRVSGPGHLSVFNVRSNSWVASDRKYVDVALEPGGGKLIAMTRGVR
jgi:hypothetical protein